MVSPALYYVSRYINYVLVLHWFPDENVCGIQSRQCSSNGLLWGLRLLVFQSYYILRSRELGVAGGTQGRHQHGEPSWSIWWLEYDWIEIGQTGAQMTSVFVEPAVGHFPLMYTLSLPWQWVIIDVGPTCQCQSLAKEHLSSRIIPQITSTCHQTSLGLVQGFRDAHSA